MNKTDNEGGEANFGSFPASPPSFILPGMQMTPLLIWMEKICKADEFVLSLQEIPEIVVGIEEEVADLDEEVAMAAVETHQAQKPITGLLLKTYQAAPHGRIWKTTFVLQEKSPTPMLIVLALEKELWNLLQKEVLSTHSSITMNLN